MYEDRIAIDPAVRHGKPIIRGTRVPLEIILGSLAGGLAVLQGHNVDLHQSCPIVALGIGHISSSLSHLRRSGHHLLGGPQALADESRRGGLGSSGYLMVRGLFMPLGRVILAASEARVSGQASRNSSATNIAICLIEDQLQSNEPTHPLSGQSLPGVGRRSELSLLLRCSEHSFLKRVLARIMQCVNGAADAINGIFGKKELWMEIGFWRAISGAWA